MFDEVTARLMAENRLNVQRRDQLEAVLAKEPRVKGMTVLAAVAWLVSKLHETEKAYYEIVHK